MHTRRIPLVSGAMSGLASLLIFMIIHAIWITPIWFVLPLGIVLAVSGGVVVSWAYAELKHRLPPPPWTVLALAAIVFTTLVPAFVLAQLHQPFIAMDGTLLVEIPVLVRHFIFDLLITASSVGALIGWWLARSRRAVLATALAGIVFALGPGHNTTFVTLAPGVARVALKMFTLLAVIIFIAAVVLVYGQALLLRHHEIANQVDAFKKLDAAI